MSPWLALGLVVVLIAANGLFVAAEFSLVAVRRPGIEDAAERGDRQAQRVSRQLHRLSFMLSAAQFGITLSSLLVGFLAEGAIGDTLVVPVLELVGAPPEALRGISIAVAFMLSTAVQMVVGELAPKNLAIARPEPVVRGVAVPMGVFATVFGPVVKVFDAAAGWVTRTVFRVEVTEELRGGHTLTELGRIIEASTAGGKLTEQEAGLLTRAVGMWDRRIAEVLVPDDQVRWLDATDTLADLRSAAAEHGFSRFPVRDQEEVLGTVHVRDLLRIGQDGVSERTAVGRVAEDCLVVPTSERLRRLLQRFRRQNRTFAVVMDEFGAIVGIVTLEDLLEELVGEIEDEFDPPEPSPRRGGRP